ncbi:uncharacterized protein PHACADRAFT_196513 [Phanerochaete carnosa HHB-10118-sp]|uniref:Uncharacterized protein n=1 Tax=Phanerochaete carnosa (strain HHB-10118-sp) TaxID=650164 RepID=K5W555_PHACS|nr:uncharacterized protein PHACADRAFT_196513 [Phanerochaete carnosa HHB-10118-sp]EKM54079.1 hypothetical protein PHACADRAFT_196513 [Phanerochaete carnosa HHB-10118-sp]
MYFTLFLVWALAATIAVSRPSPKDRHEVRTFCRSQNTSTTQPEFSTSAGASLNASEGTFTSIVASTVIPYLSVPENQDLSLNYSASFFVGVGVISCENALAAGIGFSLQNGTQTNTASLQVFPATESHKIRGISFSPGDNVTVAVTALNATSGEVVMINQSMNQIVSKTVYTSYICREDVEVIVQQKTVGDSLVPLANFSTIDFTGVYAGTNTDPVNFSSATLLNIRENHTDLTYVSASSLDVAITFL